MPTWTLSVRTAPESGLPSVDVEVHARPEATVADLARALGQHLAPDQRRLDVVPLDGTHPWPAARPLAECGLRTGDLIDVVTAPHAWRDRPAQTTKPRAVLHVIDGPDRGQRLHVRGSSVSLGRGAHCTMRFTDSLISQQHARIELGARPTVYDEGSANGTTVGDLRVTSPREVDWGTAIRLGRSTVVIEPGEVASTDPVVSVFRPPRFGNPLAEETLDLPSPPEKRRPSPLPWAMFALPVVMGLAMFMRSQTPYALVYMLAWPLVGYFGWRQQRTQAEKEFQEELLEWREDVDALITTIDDQAVLQRQRFHDDYADAETLRTRAAGRNRYLWARREDRDAFLVTRLGLGTVPALLRGQINDGGDRQARREIASELAERDQLEDMPVLADLAQHSLVAITGEPDDVDALVRAMLLRLAFDHSPTDLSVAGCLGRVRSGHETWLRWLPHAAAREGGEPPVAVGVQAGSALLDHILSEDGRRAHTICLVDEEAGLSRRTVEAVAASATDRQLHLVWLGRSADEVPAATTLLIDLTASPGGTVNLSDRRGVASIDVADRVTLEHAWRTARLMTAYVDEAAVLPASTAIPAHVRLSDVSPDFADLDDADAVLRRWTQSTGLRAQIGAGVDGVVTIDLREDGPHGLVAGTTGSGKSELLQSLICSLALNNPPSRINFLLVDYKGGAAFRECGDLPHTVGYITDLTPALVGRALTSLSAEIAAREHLLAEYGVKDLVQLERERPDAAPPSLLICVDEFAALTAEVPDFVDGMVNIAQRGRSLGMHVILATQRPAGVVTGNIRANADLRIALRVSSREDSQDVIEAPDATHISRRTPGRAWIRRTGHGTAELVQSAWTGARQPLAGGDIAVEVSAFTAAGREPDLDQVAARLDPRTDLERCVTTITTAFERSAMPAPAQPWLPPLPAELLLDEADLASQATAHSSGRVVIGRIDEPAAQRQPALAIDFASVGHLLVYGASGSGKTELLRTALLAASVSDPASAGGVAPYVYGIDFAGGGLTAISGLPTVEAIVPESHTGRVLRLIRLLKRTMRERTHTLASRGCSDIADLARAGISLPRVYVAIDNLPALVESLESAGGLAREHVEHLQAVLQNGRRVGVHVIATVPGRSGVPSSLSSAFGQRIVMRMTTADDYLMLGVAGNVLDADTPAGAGLLGKRSVQIATTGGAGTPAQAERVADIGALLGPEVSDRAHAPVPAMPSRLDESLLPAPTDARIAIAVDADAVALLEVDLLAAPVLIAGRSRSGRTSALDAVESLVRRGDGSAHVIREPAAAATMERLNAWLSAEPEVSGSWSLVMVDDAQVWDTEAGVDADSRTARDDLLRAVAEHPKRIALLATADTTQAKVRGSVGALVDAVRQGRRGFLLQPEWNDGDVLGVTVPTKTVEPLAGMGRGLWCDGGSAVVAQLVTSDGQRQLTQDGRDVR